MIESKEMESSTLFRVDKSIEENTISLTKAIHLHGIRNRLIFKLEEELKSTKTDNSNIQLKMALAYSLTHDKIKELPIDSNLDIACSIVMDTIYTLACLKLKQHPHSVFDTHVKDLAKQFIIYYQMAGRFKSVNDIELLQSTINDTCLDLFKSSLLGRDNIGFLIYQLEGKLINLLETRYRFIFGNNHPDISDVNEMFKLYQESIGEFYKE